MQNFYIGRASAASRMPARTSIYVGRPTWIGSHARARDRAQRSLRRATPATRRSVMTRRRGPSTAPRVGQGCQYFVNDRYAGDGGDAGRVVAGRDFDHVEANDFGTHQGTDDLLQLPSI